MQFKSSQVCLAEYTILTIRSRFIGRDRLASRKIKAALNIIAKAPMSSVAYSELSHNYWIKDNTPNITTKTNKAIRGVSFNSKVSNQKTS